MKIDPAGITNVLMVLIMVGSGIATYFTKSDRKRRARIKKLETENVDAFGYIYELRSAFVRRSGTTGLPPPPPSLKLDDIALEDADDEH